MIYLCYIIILMLGAVDPSDPPAFMRYFVSGLSDRRSIETPSVDFLEPMFLRNRSEGEAYPSETFN